MQSESIEVKFLNLTSLNLPDHKQELDMANVAIEKLKTEFETFQNLNELPDQAFYYIYEESIRILDYLGKLSQFIFDIEDKIEDMYTKTYIHSPALAKTLWLDHKENLHHNYDLLKNRCWRLLDNLDETYENIHGKKSPNWNI